MTAHRLRVRYTTGLCAGGGTLDLAVQIACAVKASPEGLAVKFMPLNL